jgi:outer membrane lipoprotein-sorting protein
MRHLMLFSVLALAVLSGCGQTDQTPPPKLFEGQLKAMDKAKGVQDTLQQQADQQMKDIDQQTQ